MNDQKNNTILDQSVETILTHHGREPDDQFGFVNTPVYRGSTILFKSLAELELQQQRFTYGRAGNPALYGSIFAVAPTPPLPDGSAGAAPGVESRELGLLSGFD